MHVREERVEKPGNVGLRSNWMVSRKCYRIEFGRAYGENGCRDEEQSSGQQMT